MECLTQQLIFGRSGLPYSTGRSSRGGRQAPRVARDARLLIRHSATPWRLSQAPGDDEAEDLVLQVIGLAEAGLLMLACADRVNRSTPLEF